MLRALAVVFGILFLAGGILGFIPSAMPNGLLLGYFQVNLAHNLVHLLTGVIALFCGLSGAVSSLWFFRLFGIVYALVAIHGFIYESQPILGIIANNAADTWLHTGVAVVSLLLGFGCCSRCTTR